MNIAALQKKLLAAARLNPPGETVPHAFEKRIMARLRACAPVDGWSFWGAALWRAAAPCVAIMLLAGAWNFIDTDSNSAGDSLSVALENTVLAPLDIAGETW